ncbi:MAG: DUF4129 domain-containing protein [Anaerolineae bacterium]|nr:DUF4129 domain-containing protein [Anaerolineae bacterium]
MSGDEPLGPWPEESSWQSLPEASSEGDGGGAVQPEELAQRGLNQMAIEEVARPLAVAAMLTCIGVSISQLMRLFSPAWPGTVFAGLIFLISLESIHADRFIARARLEGKDKFRFRFVEWVVMLLLVRFAVYLEYGPAQLLQDLTSWSTDMGAFFDIGFIAKAFLIAAAWALALMLSRILQELEASPLEKPPSVTDPDYYLRSTMPHHGRVDRQARLNRIVSIFFAGGVLVLLLAGMVRVDVQELVRLQHARTSGVILNVLLYFVLGFLLISQARYTILKANWELQDIPILDRLGRRWLVWVILFLVGIGIVSALLPVGYSVGVLDAVGTVVRWIIYVLVQIAFFALFVISYLIGLLLSLFTGRTATSPSMQAPMAPPQPAATPSGGNPWWELVRSLIFWTVLLGIIGYSVFHFLAFRLGLLQSVKLRRIWEWLTRFWFGMRRATRRAADDLRRRLAERLASRRMQAARARWRYLSLRKLSPRDRIRYFYLSVLYRSAQQGLGRPPAATPLEYEDVLADELSDVADQVEDLTEAFIEARYSAHDLDSQDSSRVQQVWRQVRRALTVHRRRRSES